MRSAAHMHRRARSHFAARCVMRHCLVSGACSPSVLCVCGAAMLCCATPAAGGAGSGASYGGFNFSHQAASDIFQQFFGTNNPFEAFGSGRVRMGGMDMGGLGGMFGGGFGDMGASAGMSKGPVKGELVKTQLLCTLEELYLGCSKRLKVTRKRLCEDGRTTRMDEKILEINVKPGWKPGTTITFPNEGDEGANKRPSDLAFVIGEKPHPRFTREGNNLVHRARITLAQALTDCTISVRTLDNRTLSIPCNEVIKYVAVPRAVVVPCCWPSRCQHAHPCICTHVLRACAVPRCAPSQARILEAHQRRGHAHLQVTGYQG